MAEDRFYTQEDKKRLINRYKQRYGKSKIYRVAVLAAFAVLLILLPKKLMYTKRGRTVLYGLAAAFGCVSALIHYSVMKCPLCGRFYGIFYKHRPAVCPHCDEYIGYEKPSED